MVSFCSDGQFPDQTSTNGQVQHSAGTTKESDKLGRQSRKHTTRLAWSAADADAGPSGVETLECVTVTREESRRPKERAKLISGSKWRIIRCIGIFAHVGMMGDVTDEKTGG
jgi:hypothetical protein